jgi:hypothetical protein
VGEIHRKMEIFAKVTLGHAWQVYWVYENQAEEQVFIVISDLVQLLGLYLTYRLVLLVDLLIGAI